MKGFIYLKLRQIWHRAVVILYYYNVASNGESDPLFKHRDNKVEYGKKKKHIEPFVSEMKLDC